MNEGTITSSPGPTPAAMQASSSASVPDGVRKTRPSPVMSANWAVTRSAQGPSPEWCPDLSASPMYDSAERPAYGRLKGMKVTPDDTDAAGTSP